MICPLCQSSKSELFDQDKQRSFFKCNTCDLIFVPRTSLVSLAEEKARYDEHENADDNSGYLIYLSKIAESIKANLVQGETGLDFGSGKTKLLEKLLDPYPVISYDLFYHPDTNCLTKKFHFIILSEVIEHLRTLNEVMHNLKKMLLPGGKIFIKTKLRPDSGKDFSNWFYKRDITHIQFFNEKSLDELSRILSFEKAQNVGEDLFLFQSTIAEK